MMTDDEDREPDPRELPHSFQDLLTDNKINFEQFYGNFTQVEDESLLESFGGMSLADQDYGLPPPETFEVGITQQRFQSVESQHPYKFATFNKAESAESSTLPQTPLKHNLLSEVATPTPIIELVPDIKSEKKTSLDNLVINRGDSSPTNLVLDSTTTPTVTSSINVKPDAGKRKDDTSNTSSANMHKNTDLTELPVTPKDKQTGIISYAEDEDGINELSEFYSKFKKLTLALPLASPKQPDKQTLIYLSPLSYKHVFSRPWVNKKYLSTIVERPQRLMACSLGIASAMALFPGYFKLDTVTRRSSLYSPHVVRVHGKVFAKLLYGLCEDSPNKLSQGKLEVPEDWNYGDIYLSKETVHALEGVVGSLEEAIDVMFKQKTHDQVFLTIRPPGHHCHPCVPSGFCLINNVHIAIQYSKEHYGITHACILDFDLHHGDGTQDMCWRLVGFKGDYDEEDPFEYVHQQSEIQEALKAVNSSPKKSGRKKVIDKTKIQSEQTTYADPANAPINLAYLSIQDINSFPTETGYATEENIKNASLCLDAHGLFIWNIHMEPYSDEADFNRIYEKSYKVLFEKARQFLHRAKEQSIKNQTPFNPIIIMSAGFDGSEHENHGMQRHGASVPTSFYNRFTRDAVSLAQTHSNSKLLSLLEGGYSDAALSTGMLSHLTGLINQPWKSDWASESVIKSFEKGCKLKWNSNTSASSSSSDYSQPSWLKNGIELGRSLWPSDVKAQVAIANSSAATTGRRLMKHTAVVDPTLLATPSRVLRDRTKKPYS